MLLKNWNDLKVLLALHRHKTMTEAAKSLQLNTTTVSRRLERLTDEIGTTLFVRRGSTWTATPAGQDLINVTESVFFLIQGADVFDANYPPTNRTLQLSVNKQILCDVISNNLERFLGENPNISIHLHEEKRSVAFGDADVHLGFEEPVSGRSIRTLLGTVKYAVYAKSEFADRVSGYVQLDPNGRRESPCVDRLRIEFQTPRLVTSHVSEGVSIASKLPLAICLPTRYAERQPGFVRIRPNEQPVDFPVWATYHESRRLDPNVRILIDFLKECFSGERRKTADVVL